MLFDFSTARLIVASDSKTRIGAAADWLRAQSPDAELLIVAPSWEAADDLARADAGMIGARFGLKRMTLDRLAGWLARPALARQRRAPASELSLIAVIARVVHQLLAEDALGRFAPVARRPGFARAVARTLVELRMSAADGRVLAQLERETPDLAVIAARVERELAAAALADRAVIYEAATAAAAGDSAPHPVGAPLVLLDLPLASGRELELVATLVRRAPQVMATAASGEVRTIARLTHVLGNAAQVLDSVPSSTSLGALQTNLFGEKAPPPGRLDGTVTLHSAPGEARECVEIARRIQAEAERGVPFDQMAIFLHAPGEYTAHVEEALRRAGIPAFFALRARRPHPAGRALLALLACAAEQLSARRFAEYLSLAQVPDPPDSPSVASTAGAEALAGAWQPPQDDLLPMPDTIAAASQEPAEDVTLRDPESVPVIAGTLRAPWRWERLLVDAAVIGGKERWVRRLGGLEREMQLRREALDDGDEARVAAIERILRDLAHLREFSLPLIERLAALPAKATWGEWLTHLRELAAAALRHPAPVLATLAELAPMAPVGPIDLDEVRLVLGPRLRDLADRPAGRRYGSVFVAPTAEARGLAFRVVFVPGLAERLFPRKIVEDPILPDATRSALEGSGALASGELEIQSARAAAERMALQLAIGAAGERVHLSYPRLDVEQARARMPSFYALETLRAVEGKLPGFEELSARAETAASARLGYPAPERPEEAIDEAEYDLAVLAPLLGSDEAAAAGSARYVLSANAHLARALRARALRWDTRWTVADGLVKPDDLARTALSRHLLTGRSYSPTALQNFAVCPYRFFLQAVHRLEPREDPVAIEVIDPLTRGALVHEVQFELLSVLQAEDQLPVRPGTLEAARGRLDQILDAVAARYEDRLAPAIKRVWDDGIDSIRADLRDWLRRQAQAEDGWVPHRFELSFGLAEHERSHADPGSVPGPVPVAGNLRLRGSIDLVERRPGGQLRVTDHKTGKAWAKENVMVGGGEVLQPVFYALACERVLGSPVESGRLYYCTADGGFSERIVPLDPSSREAAKAIAEIIDHGLGEGFLPAAPRRDGCKYCDYRPVCGPHEELRVARKPRERLANLLRLREMR